MLVMKKVLGISLVSAGVSAVFLVMSLVIGIAGYKEVDLKEFFAQAVNWEVEVGSLPDKYWRVTRIVDGDTVEVNSSVGEQIVRLVGVDTPETKDPRKKVECFGEEAADYLEALVLDKLVLLETDNLQGRKDRYGRWLAYIYLEDGTDVNAKMVGDGYAFAYREIDSEKLTQYVELEKKARQNLKGLWGACEL